MIVNLYRTFPEERYIGMYQGTLPTLLIRDPEIIKRITVKEFDHFPNHRSFIPDDVEPLWSKNLVFLKDMAWRDMRSTLSPSFTSNKMKIIFSLITDCASIYVDYFSKQGKKINIELKDTTTRFANDVIASAAFGITCDSINEKENDFYMMGEKLIIALRRNPRFFLYSMAPKLCQVLKLKLFPAETLNFFVKLIEKTIHIRETQAVIRPDMINQLLESRKGKTYADSSEEVIDTGFATVQESFISSSTKQILTNFDITAQALIFFFAGFDSVATVMSFLGHELAVNPDVQQRLQDEIDDTLHKCNGNLTYEALMKMKYMDMVISEVLRKWPPGLITDRVCSKTFTIEPIRPHERSLTLNPGDLIFIPISGIHRDPQYYPNPDKFDPERFNDENKAKIKPYTYLPFGFGPRSCIGSRFGILEIKIIFFYILSKFNLVATEKTQIPIVLDKKNLSILGENGMWVALKRRNK
ncbi:hypothetical protein Trydic_g20833 [Trypoxylus dichotomus]